MAIFPEMCVHASCWASRLSTINQLPLASALMVSVVMSPVKRFVLTASSPKSVEKTTMFLFMVIHFHLFSVFYFIFLNSAAVNSQHTNPGFRVRFQQSIPVTNPDSHRFPTCFFEDSLGSFLACLQTLVVLRILYLSFTVIAAPET
jgi:hypothetical protein